MFRSNRYKVDWESFSFTCLWEFLILGSYLWAVQYDSLIRRFDAMNVGYSLAFVWRHLYVFTARKISVLVLLSILSPYFASSVECGHDVWVITAIRIFTFGKERFHFISIRQLQNKIQSLSDVAHILRVFSLRIAFLLFGCKRIVIRLTLCNSVRLRETNTKFDDEIRCRAELPKVKTRV